jgi:ribosomal protein S18 acetylase RimI-like enzyme
MSDILTDLSEQAQSTAISANLCEFFRHLARSQAVERHSENEKFTRWHTPLPHPWFNGVLCSGPFEETDIGFVADTIAYFQGKGVSTFTWWLEPPFRASDWKSALSQQGFALSNETPGLAVVLQELDEASQAVDGLEIRLVEDETSLRTWADIFTRGYGLPLDWEPLVFELGVCLGLDFPVKNYVGLLHGKAVATSSLFYGAGVVGIYSVSTLPEARGQGIGAAMTLRPLLEARERGYRIGILQSSKMGFNVYRRLGFKHLGQIENFYRSFA